MEGSPTRGFLQDRLKLRKQQLATSFLQGRRQLHQGQELNVTPDPGGGDQTARGNMRTKPEVGRKMWEDEESDVRERKNR
jgi:hypothetical protein